MSKTKSKSEKFKHIIISAGGHTGSEQVMARKGEELMVNFSRKRTLGQKE